MGTLTLIGLCVVCRSRAWEKYFYGAMTQYEWRSTNWRGVKCALCLLLTVYVGVREGWPSLPRNMGDGERDFFRIPSEWFRRARSYNCTSKSSKNDILFTLDYALRRFRIPSYIPLHILKLWQGCFARKYATSMHCIPSFAKTVHCERTDEYARVCISM